MTHREQLIGMLTATSTEYKEHFTTEERDNLHAECFSYIQVENTEINGKKVTGYNGFGSEWLFGQDGSLIATEAYE